MIPKKYSRAGLAKKLGVIFACVVAAACADKAFRPVTSAGSPKIQLQFNAVGAKQLSSAGKRQVIVAVAAYQSTVLSAETDSFRILAGPVVASVTGSTQSITLNVDLTGCLADPTRKGSQTACSLYYGVWLHDSATYAADSTDSFDKNAYDYTLVGPVDVAPGAAPVLPSITLSTSRFSVFQFIGDETMRLGGPLTPTFFSGPITGSTAGVAAGSPPVLYSVTSGFQNTTSCSGQNNCQSNGYNAAQLAIFQNGTWSRVGAAQGVGQFNDVAAFSPSDVYLAGPNGVYHYDGTAITPVSATSGESVTSIGVVTSGTAKYVVAGTSTGNAWFGNTTTWTKYSLAATGNLISGVCVNSATEAFAASNGGGLFIFNGTGWTSVPSSFSQPKGDLQCTGPGHAFVWAQNTALLSWNGSGWTQLPSVGRTVRLAAVSPTEIYAAGDSGATNRNFYRFDGSSWHLLATSQFQQPMQYRPWADPRGGAAYFASSQLGRVEMVSGTSVHPVSYAPSMRDAIMTSATNAFIVGWNMFLARWNGVTWNVDPPPTGTVTTRILNGVFSDGPSNAWAVGGSSTILHWNGSSWSVVSDSIHPIALPRDSYNAVWGVGGTVWIAGSGSILRCTSVTLCTPDPVSGIDSLYGIWLSSATSGWAVGSHGKILQFNGTQWSSVSSPTGSRFVRLWGSSPTNVWAMGDSVVAQYNGTAWTVQASASQIFQNGPQSQPQTFTIPTFELGMWGTGPNEVYVGTTFGEIARWDGLQWNDVNNQSQSGGRVVAISGYTGGCPIAILDVLESGYAPSFLRGVGPTGCGSSPMPVTTPWP